MTITHPTEIPTFVPVPTTTSAPHDAYLLLAGSVLAIVGAFLPWATLSAVFVGTISITGVGGGDGYIAIALAVPLVVFAARKLGNKNTIPAGWAITFSALLLALSVFEFGDAQNKIDKANTALDGAGRASVGLGLVVLVAGAVCALVGSIMAKNRQREIAQG